MLAAIVPVTAMLPAVAQTVPYQYSRRGEIGTDLGQASLPKGGVFQPRIETAVQYVTNLTLVSDGLDQVDTAGLEIAPGFYASYSSGSVIGAIDYSLIGRAWEDSGYNDVAQRLAANGQWLAVPEWFALRGQASYDDAVLNPANGLNYGGLGIFGPSNLAEMATASVTPTLRHRFDDFEAIAEYTYGRVWYIDQGQTAPVVGFIEAQDSKDQYAQLRFGTAEADPRPLSAHVFYEWQHSEYDLSVPYDFERAGLNAEWQVARALAVVGDGGKESDLDVSTTRGGLDSSFWSAGLRWAPSERSSAEARFGQRFFGDSSFLSLRHRARMLQFDASYSEQPTVQTRQLSLGQFDPGQLPPGPPGTDFGRLNSSPYVEKAAHASVTALGSRTRVSLAGHRDDRNYLNSSQADETDTGVSLAASRQLGSNLSGDLSLSYTEFERTAGFVGPVPTVATRDYYTQALLRLNRKAGARLTITGETGYLNRTNHVGAQNYNGWWVGLRAKYEP